MANKSRSTTPVRIGTAEHSITVGGDAPIVVQSMTNTDTADVYSTVKQVIELAMLVQNSSESQSIQQKPQMQLLKFVQT